LNRKGFFAECLTFFEAGKRQEAGDEIGVRKAGRRRKSLRQLAHSPSHTALFPIVERAQGQQLADETFW
jgi:hypothetical protein